MKRKKWTRLSDMEKQKGKKSVRKVKKRERKVDEER
jgi:hypothetical protein